MVLKGGHYDKCQLFSICIEVTSVDFGCFVGTDEQVSVRSLQNLPPSGSLNLQQLFVWFYKGSEGCFKGYAFTQIAQGVSLI